MGPALGREGRAHWCVYAGVLAGDRRGRFALVFRAGPPIAGGAAAAGGAARPGGGRRLVRQASWGWEAGSGLLDGWGRSQRRLALHLANAKLQRKGAHNLEEAQALLRRALAGTAFEGVVCKDASAAEQLAAAAALGEAANAPTNGVADAQVLPLADALFGLMVYGEVCGAQRSHPVAAAICSAAADRLEALAAADASCAAVAAGSPSGTAPHMLTKLELRARMSAISAERHSGWATADAKLRRAWEQTKEALGPRHGLAIAHGVLLVSNLGDSMRCALACLRPHVQSRSDHNRAHRPFCVQAAASLQRRRNALSLCSAPLLLKPQSTAPSRC